QGGAVGRREGQGVPVRADARVADAAAAGEDPQGAPIALIGRTQIATRLDEDQPTLELELAGAATAAITVEVGAELAPGQPEGRAHHEDPEARPSTSTTPHRCQPFD